ncbi:MAG: hypothetical protein L6Q47_05795 [Ignavibacteriaceae bacterium]|nr:hypothetical protein [Ignavibacteriaceae bacterium]
MKRLIVILTFLISVNSCNENPIEVKSENRSPVIFSLTVFPEVIGPSDSAIIICNAMDPDGDTLVFDWITDARVKLKGAFADNSWLFHTYENSRIFYPTQYVNIPVDTPWVQCFARDVKGKSTSGMVRFIVRQDGGEVNTMKIKK